MSVTKIRSEFRNLSRLQAYRTYPKGAFVCRPVVQAYQHHRAMSTGGPAPLVKVTALDHIVLTVKSISTSVHFYETVLGMKHTQFNPPTSSQQRHALIFGAQKINLHESGKEFEPKAGNVMPGSADICFLTDESVDDLVIKLQDQGISVLEGGGVVRRTGARGELRSVYFRDPDQNLIEVSNMA